jgi:hypothetical protein
MSIRHDEKAANRERKRGMEAEGRGGGGIYQLRNELLLLLLIATTRGGGWQ